jgi:hypothetical protein
MRCSQGGMWQKTREIARYDERDELEQGNTGMKRHGDIMERVKRSKSPMIPENVLHNNTLASVTLLFFLHRLRRCSWLYISGLS